MRSRALFTTCLGAAALLGGPVIAADEPSLDPNRTVGVEAYPTDASEDLAALIAGAGTTRDHDGADLVAIFDRTEAIVEPTGLGHVTRRRLFKVLTEPGAMTLATLRFDWDPASNVIELKRARVYRDGEVLREIGPDQLIDLPQPQKYIYWGARMKLLPVGRLAVGDALEVETYEKGFVIAYLDDVAGASAATGAADDERYIPPMRGHFYAVPVFGDQAYPILEQRYVASLPRDKPLQFQIVNGDVHSEVTFDGDRIRYAFWMTKLPPYKKEPISPWFTDVLPKVVMATVPDWEAKSRWFYEVNAQQFAANDAIKAKVREVTKGKKGDARIHALLHWVAQEIRYSGITMGQGEGYTLHTGEMTFNDRAGVCKDIAGMLVTMLRADGHTVYPAMTQAGSRVEKVPADQFNHCVVALKQDDGSFRMLDPTWAPFSQELWSNAEREQHYVVGTPEGDTLRETPALPAEANRLSIVGETALTAQGDLSGKLTFTGTGYLETRLRYHVVYRAASELLVQLKRFVAGLSPFARLDRHALADVHDLGQDFAFKLSFTAPGYATTGDGLLAFRMPLAQHLVQGRRLGFLFQGADADERSADLLFRSTEWRTYRERLTLPRGYRLAGGPVRARVKGGKVADFEAKIEQVGRTLELTERIRLHQRRVTPGEFAEYKTVIDAAKRFGARTLYLETTAGGAR